MITGQAAVADQTEYRWQIPASENWRWSNLRVDDLSQTGSDLGAPERPEQIKSVRTMVEHEEEVDVRAPRTAQVKRRVAVSGQPATSSGARHHLADEAVRILRLHYFQVILSSLEGIQPHAQTTRAARHAGDLLDALATYIERLPDDPAVEVALAIYPALADRNHWADWSSEQLKAVHGVFSDLATRQCVNAGVVEKAIVRLEEQGELDTLPFEVDPRGISQ